MEFKKNCVKYFLYRKYFNFVIYVCICSVYVVQKILIIRYFYNVVGCVIVGFVDGNRIWGKEFRG